MPVVPVVCTDVHEAPQPTVVVLAGGGRVVGSWLLRAERVDLGVVDRLAHLNLVARRAGWTLQVRAGGPERAELLELLELAGLASVVEVVGQAEGGEQRRVHEVVVADDPVA